ncbi:MAG: hypothetical protein ACLPTZ_16300 [Beijerinckiaceae bacterium]
MSGVINIAASAVDTFVLNSNGVFVPHIREHRQLQQVAAAAMPGPQYQFLCAPEKEVGIVGNRGGGKSEALVFSMLSGIGRGWGPHYNCVLLRSSLREMTDLITMIESIVRPIWGRQVAFNRLNHVWEWKSGERVELNYFIDMSTFGLYQGKNIAGIFWEELTLQKNLGGYLAMFSSLRSALPESVMPRKVRFTANPGGPSHNAIKHRFQLSGILRGAGPCIVDENGERRRAISCSYEDNALLRRTEPRYMSSIETACEGNPPQLQAWKYGNWDIVAGGSLDDVFFKFAKTIFIETFEIPAEGKLFMSYDHGSTKPYACLFWFESNGCDVMLKSGRTKPTRPGDLFMIGEVYGWTGEPDKGTHESIAEITTKIQVYKISRAWRYRDPVSGKWIDVFKRGFADSAIGEELNEFSVQEEFKQPVQINGEKHPGINWELVSKPPGSRVTGFQLLRERLINTAPRPDSKIREGKGLFIVKDNCPNAARTLPILPRNPKNMDDVDSNAEDHCFDSARYALMADRSPHFSTRRRQVI